MIDWPSFFVGMAAMAILSAGVIVMWVGLVLSRRPRKPDYPHAKARDVEEGKVMPLTELSGRG